MKKTIILTKKPTIILTKKQQGTDLTSVKPKRTIILRKKPMYQKTKGSKYAQNNSKNIS